MKANPFFGSYFPIWLILIQLCLINTLLGQEEGEIEIASERLRLSYVDPLRCVELLKLWSKCRKSQPGSRSDQVAGCGSHAGDQVS